MPDNRDKSKLATTAFFQACAAKSSPDSDDQSKAASMARERTIDPHLSHLVWTLPGLNGSRLDDRSAEEQIEEQFARMGEGGGRYGTSAMRLHTILET